MVRSFWPSRPVRHWHRLIGPTLLSAVLATPALAQSAPIQSLADSPLPAAELDALLPIAPTGPDDPDVPRSLDTPEQSALPTPLSPAAVSPIAPPATQMAAFNASINLLDQPALPQLGDSQDFLPDEARTRLVLRLGDRRVYVYRGDEAVASYPVAIGRSGWETPKGSYEVIQMTKDPAWRHPWEGYVIPPGPDNPLGSRWIGFWTDGKNFIGFHGTPNESLIGQAVSHGCVRMRNQDIQALYAQVEMGTPVVVE